MAVKELMKKEKVEWFSDKPKKKKVDYPKAALKLAGGALLLGAGLAVTKQLLE